MKIRYRIIGALAISSIAPYAWAQDSNVIDATDDAQHHDEHHYVDEIVVSAAPLERTVEQLAQPVSVLSGDALARSHASSIGETLADQPGVSATYFGPVASRPVIRGQFGERVLVLSNGLASLDASALSEDHAVSIDSILAKRVEIVRGPATLLYGSGAAGGIVNVVDARIPEEPLDRPLTGKFALGSDSATGKREGAATVDFGTGLIVGHLDYFRRDTDDVEIPGFAESARLRALEEEEEHDEEHEEEEAFGVLENTSSEIEGGAASVTVAGDGNFVGVAVSRYSSNYGIPGHHHHAEEGEAGEEEEEGSVRIDLDQTRYDLSAGFELDGFIRGARFRVGRNEYMHLELEGDEIGTTFDNVGIDSRLELQHRPLGVLEGALGFQYKRTDFNAIGEEAFVPPSDTRQASVFIFEEARIGDSWAIQASARAENQRIDAPGLPGYDKTTGGGSIGAIWSISDATALSANLALTERHPNSTELFADGPHVAVQRFERGSVTLGRGVLDKERSTNFDLTLRGTLGPFEYNLTGFINDVDDYILLSPTAEVEDGFQVFDYGQTDVEMYGYEGELLFDIFERNGRHLHARIYSDFVYGEEKVSGNYLPRLPPLRYGIGVHYVTGKIEANIDVTHNAQQTRTAVNEIATDSFTMVDLEATYYFDMPTMMVFLRGTNLGDEDARRHTSPLKDIAPLPGRSIQLGLRLDF
jgi:iron complex outermembrane receptor protein